jgi:hypothetical protein
MNSTFSTIHAREISTLGLTAQMVSTLNYTPNMTHWLFISSQSGDVCNPERKPQPMTLDDYNRLKSIALSLNLSTMFTK